MKTETIGMLGIVIGILLIFVVLLFTSPSYKITEGKNLRECIENGGKYSAEDWSIRGDGSDYRMTCTLSRQTIWQFNY